MPSWAVAAVMTIFAWATPHVLEVVFVVALAATALIALAMRRARARRPAIGAPGVALAPQAEATRIDRLTHALCAGHEAQENAATLIADGRDAFAARELSAAAAGRSLDLMYYAWGGDAFARALAARLWEAAERGVRVRLLVDDINAEGADAGLLALDGHDRIEVRVHNPLWVRRGVVRGVELLLRFARVNHRMHNKAWIADGRLAIVGGRNIEDRYFDAADAINFRDLDMLVLGPAVAQASRIFDAFWNHPTAWPIGALSRLRARDVASARASILSALEAPQVRAHARRDDLESFVANRRGLRWCTRLVIASDPPGKWMGRARPKTWMFQRLWDWTRETRAEALIVSPYFVPRRRFTALLTRLSRRRRARVQVVTNSLAANDVAAVHGGYMRYRRKLLRAGVDLYEIRASADAPAERSVFGSSNASLHTKAALFDARRGFVGSFNMDPRSARVNTEMGVFFEDEALAADLRAEIERLQSPALSFRVRLKGVHLRWEDGLRAPPLELEDEPDSTFVQRMTARLAGWLPIEQEL